MVRKMKNSQCNNISIIDRISSEIKSSDLDEATKSVVYKNLLQLKKRKLNIMITGATGSGKSSTINALFNMEVAKVGIGVDPETMGITKYDLSNMILWDTPGLGDSKDKDIQHAKIIKDKLLEVDDNGAPLIDLILVILDGSSRDLGTSYELINKVIIPNLGENNKDRLLVAINQADVALKGRDSWDIKNNKPTQAAKEFLKKKVQSVRNRIKDTTGVDIEPIYYCAGYKEYGEYQRPYNLSKLLYFILQHTPRSKRVLYIDNISKDSEVWQAGEENKLYTVKVKETLWESFTETISEVASDCLQLAEDAITTICDFGKSIVRGACDFFSSLFNW